MIRIDTAEAAAEYLDRFPHVQGWPPEPITSFERAHFGTECPTCGALGWLCIAPTGLPASGPHESRTLAAFFSDQWLEPVFDDND